MNFDDYIRNGSYFKPEVICNLSESALKLLIDEYLQDLKNSGRALYIKKQVLGPHHCLHWNFTKKVYELIIEHPRKWYVNKTKLVTPEKLMKWIRATLRDAKTKAARDKQVEEYRLNIYWEQALQIYLGAKITIKDLDKSVIDKEKNKGILFYFYTTKIERR